MQLQLCFLLMGLSVVLISSLQFEENNLRGREPNSEPKNRSIGAFLPKKSWGKWGSMETCDPGFFVSGFRLKIEPWQGAGLPCCGTDDTSLNAIELKCFSPSPNHKSNWNTIRSSEGPWGNWHQWNNCEDGQFINAVSMRHEGHQGVLDDWAATNLRVKCTDGKSLKGPEIYATMHGHWYQYKRCPQLMVVCGLRTKIEEKQGSGDDTALNDVEIECCENNYN